METNNNVDIDVYVCKTCNKSYKNRDGIWKHNKKHHGNIVSKCKSNISQKILPSEKMETNVSQLSANVNLNKKTYYNDISDGFSCDFCGITYIHRQSKYKHQIKCKNKLVGEEKKSEQKEIINLLHLFH